MQSIRQVPFTGVLACLLVLGSCSGNKTAGPEATSGLASSQTSPAIYVPRIGLAVTTGSRTCIAIHNANLTIGSPITLVSPSMPQTFTQAEISATSASPCPITKDVDTTASNYDLHLKEGGLGKLTPLIAVVGKSAAFSTSANNVVSADLDQNGKSQSFRACSAGDGIHLTVWSGAPLDGTLLWHGFYYEPNNAAAGPACGPKELGSGQ
jgi:hypothetical protein